MREFPHVGLLLLILRVQGFVCCALRRRRSWLSVTARRSNLIELYCQKSYKTTVLGLVRAITPVCEADRAARRSEYSPVGGPAFRTRHIGTHPLCLRVGQFASLAANHAVGICPNRFSVCFCCLRTAQNFLPLGTVTITWLQTWRIRRKAV